MLKYPVNWHMYQRGWSDPGPRSYAHTVQAVHTQSELGGFSNQTTQFPDGGVSLSLPPPREYGQYGQYGQAPDDAAWTTPRSDERIWANMGAYALVRRPTVGIADPSRGFPDGGWGMGEENSVDGGWGMGNPGTGDGGFPASTPVRIWADPPRIWATQIVSSLSVHTVQVPLPNMGGFHVKHSPFIGRYGQGRGVRGILSGRSPIRYSAMSNAMKPPALAEYLASTLLYCPEEGAFYSRSIFHGEAKGELHGEVIYGRRATIIEKGTGRHLMRAGHRHNRRAVHAAKLAWFMVHGEWPYFIAHKYGLDDLRLGGLLALMTPGEYQETYGDVLYWDRAFKRMPDLPEQKTCQVVWYPGLDPEVAES